MCELNIKLVKCLKGRIITYLGRGQNVCVYGSRLGLLADKAENAGPICGGISVQRILDVAGKEFAARLKPNFSKVLI